MKRFFVFMLALAGLGVVMSGCTFGSHYIKESCIQKNYIDKVKVPESKKVGDREIKFYVGKVEDKRKYKYAWMKRTVFFIPIGKIHFKDICGTVRDITKKALFNTGWGIVDDRSKSNFVVDTLIQNFTTYMGLITPNNLTETKICLYNNYNREVVKKDLYKETHTLIAPDLTGEFKSTVGNLSVQYYKALLDYFSSPAFVNAVKKAYAEMMK